MSKKRSVYSPKRKTEIAIAAIKECETQSQLISRYNIHASQLKSWKQKALLSIERGFSKQTEKLAKQQAKLLSELYERIGHLHTQLNWLKKKHKIKCSGEAYDD